MSIPMLNKMHMNGYDVLSVNHGPWRVCTQGDRLASFASKEEAMAYAAALARLQESLVKQSKSQIELIGVTKSPGNYGALRCGAAQISMAFRSADRSRLHFLGIQLQAFFVALQYFTGSEYD
jgi:hypothetical protein